VVLLVETLEAAIDLVEVTEHLRTELVEPAVHVVEPAVHGIEPAVHRVEVAADRLELLTEEGDELLIFGRRHA
jgi:hypothetical protein